MRKNPTKNIERYRVVTGPLASDASYGANGKFMIPRGRVMLSVVVSDASGWDEAGMPPPKFEHVSVSLQVRCPTWEEMNFVKDIFWGGDETVVQFHVPKKEHVSYHDYCLHLWKPIGVEIQLPPSICVGPKT